MPTPPVPDELLQAALNLGELYGTGRKARKAGATKIPERTLDARIARAILKGMRPTVKAERDLPQSSVGHGVLAIPDCHAPFAHPDALDFLSEAKRRLKPTAVVHLGDEVDQHALAQYDPDPDGYSAGHELNKAVDWLKQLYAIFPECRVCTSNHGVRPFKRAFRAGIPKAYLKDYSEFLEAPPGWKWQDRWEVDGVIYMHGEGANGKGAAESWAMSNMKPTVIGHIHSHAAVGYFKNHDDRQIWWMNAGWLGDEHAYSVKYAKHNRHKQIVGVGFVDYGVPHYFPMRLDANGRWTGRW